LRKETEETAERLHALIAKGRTPKASYGKKCDRCSLYGICLPRSLSSKRDVKRYLEKAVNS
jgi:CRISPR-associated exonuclease Cas4